MKKSETTKHYRKMAAIMHVLSIILLAAPVLFYAIQGFSKGEVVEKFSLGVTVVIAAILFAVNVIFKYHIRSTLWILVLGIYLCLDQIQGLLIMVAVGTILDEFLLTPLYKSYKQKATINLEIDKRL